METKNNTKKTVTLFSDFDVYGKQYSYDEMKVMGVLSNMSAATNFDYEDLLRIVDSVSRHWINPTQIDKTVYEEYPWLEVKSDDEYGYIQEYASRTLPYFIKEYAEENKKELGDENNIKELVDRYAQLSKDFDKNPSPHHPDEINRFKRASKALIRAVLDENGYADVHAIF